MEVTVSFHSQPFACDLNTPCVHVAAPRKKVDENELRPLFYSFLLQFNYRKSWKIENFRGRITDGLKRVLQIETIFEIDLKIMLK